MSALLNGLGGRINEQTTGAGLGRAKMRPTVMTLMLLSATFFAGGAKADMPIESSRAALSAPAENPEDRLRPGASSDQASSDQASSGGRANDEPTVQNRKQRKPIAPALLAAADTIRTLNAFPFDETSKELREAMRRLQESTDTEGANSLALQLANHQLAKGLNNVRFVGFQILAARDRKSTLKFLQGVADRLPKAKRKRVLELHRAVARRVVAPRADRPRAARPPVKVPSKNRVRVAKAFGEPIYLDQLEPGKTVAKTQNASQRQAFRGRRLLDLISRKATSDYWRREKLEVTSAMKKSLWKSVMRAPLPPNQGLFCEEERRLVSYGWQHASLKDWVLTKSLYERYGGRVGVGSLGLWLAADGRNQLIRDYQKSGQVLIEDAKLETAFWKEATKANFADTYPQGDRLKQMLAHPPHLRYSR